MFVACLAGSLHDTTSVYRDSKDVWQLRDNASFKARIEVVAMAIQRVSK